MHLGAPGAAPLRGSGWYHGLADVSRAPGLRCRAGRAVEFKHGSSGKAVAALLDITDRATEQGDVFSVKVRMCTPAVAKPSCPWITVDAGGTVLCTWLC